MSGTHTQQNNAKTDAFDVAYKALNPSQKEAVDAIEGPVMVIAGPGTGKTQILTLRIANILLKTDSKPENILALTFTESGATAMRQRLLKYIGVEAYKVQIFTFHGFAQSLIGKYPDAYMRIIGGTPVGDIENIQCIQSILDTEGIKELRPMGDPSYYVTKIRDIIGTLKKEYITPDDFERIIQKQELELLGIEKIHQKGAHTGKVRGEYQKKEKSIAKNRELLLVYRSYTALLASKKLYDFNDMIIETIGALEKNEDLLRDLQEQYHYLLADEHQDVNGSQNRILELLSSYHEHPNIFVVGDEKQAIFRFQGASLENFLYFEDVYSKTKTISLTSNYRSGQTILDAAHSLILQDNGPASLLRVPLTSAIGIEATLSLRTFSHQSVEDEVVTLQIAKLVQDGVRPEEIAIIVRTNKEVEQFTTLLRKQQIPVEASADSDILRHPITHSVEALIEVVVHKESEQALFRVLHGSYWGIAIDDFVRVCAARSYTVSLQSIIESKEKLLQIGVQNPDRILHVAQVLASAREKTDTDAPHRVVEYLLQESGFLNYIVLHDPLEGGKVVRRLYDELEEMVVGSKSATLSDIQKAFRVRKEYNLPLKAPYIVTHTHSVQVMTAHKSKGLEFEHVFIPHVVDTIWGGGTSRTYFDIPLTKHINATEFDEDDDERRLLYVGLTRAKQQLYLSHADTNQERRALVPSRLLSSIDAAQVTVVSTAQEEEKFDATQTLMHKVHGVQIDREVLTKFLADRGISATALNNYLRSPYDYLYRNVLRMPEVQAMPMLFGTALHNVMEKVTALHTKEGVWASPTSVKEYLEYELNKMPFTAEEYSRLHEKGYQALLTYIEHIKNNFTYVTKEEFKVSVHLQTGIPEFPELLLTGKIDRLDINAEGNVVRVIDYKSGKPKTRNEIEGNTKSSNGDYKRQLTFYALLLSLYGDERYFCTSGVLTFIEADSKGNIHEETFTISKEEIENLKTELISVTKEIISGSFLEKSCDPATSSYCHLAQELFAHRDT